jgi:hypothetical protein
VAGEDVASLTAGSDADANRLTVPQNVSDGRVDWRGVWKCPARDIKSSLIVTTISSNSAMQ